MQKLILKSKNGKSAQNRPKTTKNLERIAKKFPKKNFRRRKIESCKSSETRFPEVSRRSEPSSRGERRKKFAWSQVFTPKQNRNCRITAADDSLEESLNTLRFAMQASHVKNQVANKDSYSTIKNCIFRCFSPFFAVFSQFLTCKTLPKRVSNDSESKQKSKKLFLSIFFSNFFFRFFVIFG